MLQAAHNAVSTHKYILFTDSFDSYIFCHPSEIIRKFKSFNHRMVVSAEVNLWPNPDFADQMPPSSKSGHYKYPNSGGYMAEIGYLIELFEGMGIAWKSDCVDDQGELIKAIALDADAFRIDHEAELFQTLFGLLLMISHASVSY